MLTCFDLYLMLKLNKKLLKTEKKQDGNKKGRFTLFTRSGLSLDSTPHLICVLDRFQTLLHRVPQRECDLVKRGMVSQEGV